MNKLEVFFDYTCPYCLYGHNYLLGLLPEFPYAETVWRPCEAHPRPETYGPHSDIMIRGMFIVKELGADIMEYHRLMYDAAHKDRIDVESIEAVSDYVKNFTDAGKFRAALASGAYVKELDEANDYAYEKSGVWVIPAYRMNGKKLDSKGGVGVTKEELKKFLSEAVSR